MPSASFEYGKVDLRLTLQHDPLENELDEWRAAFERASQLLHHATEGQMQFGKLSVEFATPFSAKSDAYLFEGIGRSYGNANGMYLCNDERQFPLVIVHEFGHFFLALGDEYESGVYGDCTGDETTQACIMEFSKKGDVMSNGTLIATGAVNEFCSEDEPGQHKCGNIQHQINGKSCWGTIHDKLGLTIPQSLRTFDPASHNPTEWIILSKDNKYVLIFDTSPSLVGKAFVVGQRTGGEFWIDFLRLTGNQLAFVSGSGPIILPIQKFDSVAKTNAAFNTIRSFPFLDFSNSKVSLNSASQQIGGVGERFATQSIVLVTSGDPHELQPDFDVPMNLRERGTDVSVVAVGATDVRPEWKQLTEKTGGRFHKIDGRLDSPVTSFALQNQLIELALELEPGNGLVATTANLIPALVDPPARPPGPISENNDRTNDDTDQADRNAADADINQLTEPVFVEFGCDKMFFVLSKEIEVGIEFDLIDPKGVVLNQENDFASRIVRDKYTILLVNRPVPGPWMMRTRRSRPGAATRVKMYACAHNTKLFPNFSIRQSTDKMGIEVEASVFHGRPLENILRPVVEVYPSQLFEIETDAPIQQLVLRQKRFQVGDTDQWVIFDKTVYVGSVAVSGPGLYTVVLSFANVGSSQDCDICCGDSTQKSLSIFPFMRVARRQVFISK